MDKCEARTWWLLVFIILSETHSEAFSQAIHFLIGQKNNFGAYFESAIIRNLVPNMWLTLSTYPEYVQSTMAFSGQPAHRNLSQSWFQLFFESCAIEVIQMALLRASERSGRILGNMEVYHIVYTHILFLVTPCSRSWYFTERLTWTKPYF